MRSKFSLLTISLLLCASDGYTPLFIGNSVGTFLPEPGSDAVTSSLLPMSVHIICNIGPYSYDLSYIENAVFREQIKTLDILPIYSEDEAYFVYLDQSGMVVGYDEIRLSANGFIWTNGEPNNLSGCAQVDEVRLGHRVIDDHSYLFLVSKGNG